MISPSVMLLRSHEISKPHNVALDFALYSDRRIRFDRTATQTPIKCQSDTIHLIPILVAS